MNLRAMVGTATVSFRLVTGRAAAPADPSGAAAASNPSAIPLFAYYYIWFTPASWDRAKIDYPLAGRYSSADPGVMREQIQEAKSAGIGGFIVSWKNTPTDDRILQTLMGVASQEHFQLAMIYEGLDFSRRPLPVSEVAAGFEFFRDHYASSPVWFRLNGKPLSIWSGTWDYSHAAVASVTSAVRSSMLVLSTEKSGAGLPPLPGVPHGHAPYLAPVNPPPDSRHPQKTDTDVTTHP